MELRARKVLVVGLGKSGVAACRLLAREGARITATDARGEPELRDALRALDGLGIAFQLGGHDREDFRGAELVVLSPGVPRTIEPLRLADAEEIPVIAEVELAFAFLPAPAAAALVGITGTNGKSTTTALTAHILASSGRRTFAGGNLGRPLCEAALEGGWEAVVCELSSFQLESIVRFRPRVAALLNVTPDHTDRYGDMDDYAAAKARIFMNQHPDDTAVLNARDPVVMAMAPRLRARVVSFSADAPSRYRATARTLRGAHNLENALAAAACAEALGVSPEHAQRGLDSYPGLPHRLEPVGVVGGVEYVNDSKATNVDSAEKALAAFAGGIFWIAGGRGKGAPYAPLRNLVKERVKRMLLIGEDAGRIETELGGAAPAEQTLTLEAAVRTAHRLAQPGDTVLLAPACASYDQFKNFEHRGETFRKLVEALA
jgi:UDP-N-acetylmuramoylalanine--D-glutamate ligase